jgi:hypothetical protein
MQRLTSASPAVALFSVYNNWIEDVKRTVPKDQLLVFNVKEGWEPLCKFLGVPVPQTPFPRVNDTAQFNARIDAICRMNWILGGTAAAVAAGIGYGAYRLLAAKRS